MVNKQNILYYTVVVVSGGGSNAQHIVTYGCLYAVEVMARTVGIASKG